MHAVRGWMGAYMCEGWPRPQWLVLAAIVQVYACATTSGHVDGHVYGHVDRHVYGRVYGHVYGHVDRHV